MPNHLSDKSVALYFALCAARKAATKVVITNDTLKRYFFGSKSNGRRLSEKRLRDFADSLKPIFPRSEVRRGSFGPRLVLYLNESGNDLKTEIVRVLIPDQATIAKTFGVQEAIAHT
jgi:hypothetical protein